MQSWPTKKSGACNCSSRCNWGLLLEMIAGNFISKESGFLLSNLRIKKKMEISTIILKLL